MHFLTSAAAIPLAVTIVQLSSQVAADQSTYQPCPLLRAYYPAPSINKTSDVIQAASQQFAALFDGLIQTGGSDDFGSITPNTTSFSVVLFSGAVDAVDDPIFFEYHHTAPVSEDSNGNVTLDTVFPLGTLTQLFTVYSWLIEMGDTEWESPITKFLPELTAANASVDTLAVNWDEVTVGALAGQMSGIARDSNVCHLGEPCDYQSFVNAFAGVAPVFLPDTTPAISNAAFQLLTFALERKSPRCKVRDSANIFSTAMLEPLNMTRSGFLSSENEANIFGQGMNSSAIGEPAALSLLSTTRDLARAGHAMLSSRLVPAAVTRRWLQPVADTSNLRNGVGRPWEIYHAGQYANSSVLDVYTKSGAVSAYSSYFGLAPDFGAGFAILAHDASGAAPDLNVYADVVSLAVVELEELAAEQAAARYAGEFSSSGSDDVAVFNVSSDGPGFIVPVLAVGGVDLRKQVADVAGIELEDLDFRVYPTNVIKGTMHQFVAVFQDKSAPVDMDTPTCITWQNVDSLGPDVADRFIFEINESSGSAKSVIIPAKDVTLTSAE
ncbi:Beta-lactamase [Pleurostoma richardsiae]|uniref:Beta-lactamase n=1 Tax=Pleurostoma richardsiae TaxID=41990 RepID=A0AA38RG90_9PEZI|nr:Beta-lactamase [Pleurostoma richardsiae]